MKKITIPYINQSGNTFPFYDFPTPVAIDITPWSNDSDIPTVHFAIMHDNTHIYIRYTVQENSIIAKATANNGAVWKDSCVEFFIMPEKDDVFYNFEINCIGVKLLYAGKTRNNRTPADDATMGKILTESTLGHQPFDEKFGLFDWTMTVVIPVSCFFQHTIKSVKGKTCLANFYKCGDELTKPHYLCWNNIETPKPDFHTPQYFGEIVFV